MTTTHPNRYLGSSIVPIEESPFADCTREQLILYFISNYGQIDGAHHKAWVLDQIARIACGVEPIVIKRQWTHCEPEFTLSFDDNTLTYDKFVAGIRGQWCDDEQCWEHEYDVGIPP